MFYSDLLTKKYGPGGRGPEHYDCWGLCEEIARRVGHPIPDFAGWIDIVSRQAFLENTAKAHFESFDYPAPWRIVAFYVRSIADPTVFEYHLGTVLEDCRRFIHARSKCGIAISRLAGYGEPVGFFEYVSSDNR